MYTIIETPTFQESARRLWTEAQRSDFFTWLALNPNRGSVIRGSGGCRKIRWMGEIAGKRGGVRVIYFNKLEKGEIWLLVMYRKTDRDTISAHILKQVRSSLEHE